jgi:hypothetical protein
MNRTAHFVVAATLALAMPPGRDVVIVEDRTHRIINIVRGVSRRR